VATPGGQLGRPQPHRGIALGGEAKLVAVHVIAVGDGEADLDRRRIDQLGGEAECFLWLEQIIGRAELELCHCGHPARQQQNQEENPFHALVSAATQSR
jgi:hypothetical protein